MHAQHLTIISTHLSSRQKGHLASVLLSTLAQYYKVEMNNGTGYNTLLIHLFKRWLRMHTVIRTPPSVFLHIP